MLLSEEPLLHSHIVSEDSILVENMLGPLVPLISSAELMVTTDVPRFRRSRVLSY